MNTPTIGKMHEPLNLYHGSDKIIEKPKYGFGNKYNDYGLGFYTTPSFELAAEWAVPTANTDGYVNAYHLSIEEIKILDMDNEPFEHWISILIQNRGGRFSRAVRDRKKRWLDMFPFSADNYDVIKGWRADDSYFSFVRDFFDGGLSLENLNKAMKFGDFGTQYCVVSEKAFDLLEFIEPAEPIKADVYYYKRETRDKLARKSYENMENMGRGTILYDIVGRD